MRASRSPIRSIPAPQQFHEPAMCGAIDYASGTGSIVGAGPPPCWWQDTTEETESSRRNPTLGMDCGSSLAKRQCALSSGDLFLLYTARFVWRQATHIPGSPLRWWRNILALPGKCNSPYYNICCATPSLPDTKVHRRHCRLGGPPLQEKIISLEAKKYCPVRCFGLISAFMPKTKAKKVKTQADAASCAPSSDEKKKLSACGSNRFPRSELTKKTGGYIKKHGCQDKRNETMINEEMRSMPVMAI